MPTRSPIGLLSVQIHQNLHLCALLTVIFVVVSFARYLTSPYRRLPPGPRGVPLFGNVSDLRDKRWLASTECKDKYGDVVHLSVFGRSIVILNSQKAAADLFDRRANIYSDRPRLIIGDTHTNPLHLGLTPYGSLFRRMRKASQEGFMKSLVANYHPTQALEALILTSDMLSAPDAREKHFRRAAASMIMSVVYDTPTIRGEDDPNVRNIEAHIGRVLDVLSPGVVTQVFPWIRHMPSRFFKWKRQAEEGYARDTAMLEGLVDSVRVKLSKGIDRPSFSALLIRDQPHSGLSDRENAWVAGTMYAAGGETTSGAMAWWTLAMVSHLATQARAHAELDAVVGRSRPPTFSDLPHLPYIRAMVRETLRWRPVLPLGLPHLTIADDWYEGMFIPAGTTCFANNWLCNADADAWGPFSGASDLDAFDPGRHLDDRGQLRPGPTDTKEEGHVAFGFGKRICVGKHVANNTLFINIATVLWAAEINPAKGGMGREVQVDTKAFVDDGLILRPKPFECNITPRFADAAAILTAELELRGQ